MYTVYCTVNIVNTSKHLKAPIKNLNLKLMSHKFQIRVWNRDSEFGKRLKQRKTRSERNPLKGLPNLANEIPRES